MGWSTWQPAGHSQQLVLTDGDRGEIGIAWKRFTQHRCLIKYALTHWALDVVLSSGGTTGRMHQGCKSGGHSSPARGRPCRAGLALPSWDGPGPSTPTGRAMPVASRAGTAPGSTAAAESSSRYPGARCSGVDRQATVRTAETAPQWPHSAPLMSLATSVTNRWPASQHGYKDRLRELPAGRGDHAAGLGG